MVERVLLDFFDQKFLEGWHGQEGYKYMAAWEFSHGAYSRHGHLTLPKAKRALKGWDKSAPGHSRIEEVLDVWCTLAVEMKRHGKRMVGI